MPIVKTALLITRPNSMGPRKNGPPHRKSKILRYVPFWNFRHTITKYGNSPERGSKAMKPTLESFFFYLKNKYESNRQIGMIGMIKPLNLPVTLRDVSKNH